MYLYIYLSLNIWVLFMSINIWMHVHVYKYIYLRRPLLSRVTGKMTKMLTYADVYIYNRIYIYMHICAGHYYRTWQGRWGKCWRMLTYIYIIVYIYICISAQAITIARDREDEDGMNELKEKEDELAADSVRLHIVSIRHSIRQHTSAHVSRPQQTS